MNYKTYREYQKAFSEVDFVINNLEKDVQAKIPDNLKELIRNNMYIDYIVKFNLDVGIENCHLSDKAKNILSLIYINYICTKQEREEIIEKWKKNYLL